MATALPATRAALDAALHAAIVADADRLMGLCARMLGNEADAADALQEAWLRAWRNRDAFRGDGPAGAWLRAIVVRECLRSLRWRAWTRLLPLSARDDDLAAATTPAEGGLDAARVRTLVARLPPRQRVAFNLRHEEGLTVPEIAAAMGLSTETVKTHLDRALGRLRSDLGGRDG